MINRKEKFLWILYGIVLAALFLLSSTDLIIKEQKAEVYPISVIIEDTSDDYYVNFRKGMERAAVELNADVSFITLYEQGNRTQQMNFVLREQEDGNRALIVAPVDEEMVGELQALRKVNEPLVLLNVEKEQIKGEYAAGITFDYYRLGSQLGQRLLEEQPEEYPVYLFSCKGNDLVNHRMAEGLCSVLDTGGREWREFCLQQGSDLETVLKEKPTGAEKGVVVAALDPESLTAAAQLAENDEAGVLGIRGLYGRGNTVSILDELDKGVIQGLCITDDFSAGYLSVKAAVELINGRFDGNGDYQNYREGSCIGRKELKAGTYEKQLYPIE